MNPADSARRTRLQIDPVPVRALGVLFDDDLGVPEEGDPLPPLWHWAALSRWSRPRDGGPDGHLAAGGFLPDVGKPRRMFAGGVVEFGAPLIVGMSVTRDDRVLEVTPKRGRQGDFVLVRVESLIYDHTGSLAVREVQDLVYRDGATPSAALPRTSAGPAPLVARLLVERGDQWEFRTDPTLLFRFSSATANAHRIHYDLDYARQAEGYPDLVVHGPLMSMALARVAGAAGIGRPRRLRHRNLRPLFCGLPGVIHEEPVGTDPAEPGTRRWSLVADGQACVSIAVDP